MAREIIPLSDLPSDGHITVDVDSLGLPVGLDLSRIGFNHTNTRKVIHHIGTSSLIIQGETGQADETVISGSFFADGSIASAQAVTRQQDRGTRITQRRHNDVFDTTSILTINNAARRDDMKDIAAQYDPTAQAQSLNRAVKEQLYLLNREVNRARGDKSKLLLDGVRGANFGIAVASTAMNEFQPTPTSSICAGLLSVGIGLSFLARHSAAEQIGLEPHHSIFQYSKYDRMVISSGFIATHSFFSSIK